MTAHCAVHKGKMYKHKEKHVRGCEHGVHGIHGALGVHGLHGVRGVLGVHGFYCVYGALGVLGLHGVHGVHMVYTGKIADKEKPVGCYVHGLEYREANSCEANSASV